MTLTQLENLIKINEDITNPEYGVYYNKRSIQSLLDYGLILIDKPPGPTSHEVVAWTKRMQNRDNLTELDALKIVKKRFDENKIIYKTLYNFEFGEDLSVFDKIIETDGLNAQEVLDEAKSVVRELL